jgi:excisionase family DNA binding protein
MNEILTISEVSDYLRLSRTTVWRWCNEGRLPAFKIGRGWRVLRADVEKLTTPDFCLILDRSVASREEGCEDLPSS